MRSQLKNKHKRMCGVRGAGCVAGKTCTEGPHLLPGTMDQEGGAGPQAPGIDTDVARVRENSSPVKAVARQPIPVTSRRMPGEKAPLPPIFPSHAVTEASRKEAANASLWIY